ncbi:MAG: L-threonylcarbamoyladenylate synthase [Candidatus Nomurabacteria bacterium]|jgi:L-threonylcarbamoyladenylate synthase|nr:L-threonylcarbamoyladenylate synthase [Candidatus Nomurabacteria bacterium]
MKTVEKSCFEEMDWRGKVAAVPTETVFGLACKFDDEVAVRKMMEIKNRGIGSGKVFSLLVSSLSEIERFAVVDDFALGFLRSFFGKSLTVILPRKGKVSRYFDNFETIGFRLTGDEFLLSLVSAVGPLILTSANYRGVAPYATSGEVALGMPEVDFVVRGAVGGSLPTTVVKIEGEKIEVLRQGEIVIG